MSYNVDDLLRVMQRLRDPDTGCPWDLRQDFQSIVPSTLEECYELAQAIEHADYPHVAEELGDVLFQVIFYAQLGTEQGLFSFSGIVNTLVEKLLRRHPHVFADGAIEGVLDSSTTVAEVNDSWEAIKQQERNARAQTSAMADIPLALPALPRAQKLQKRAARRQFDWSDTAGALDKPEAEIHELRQAMQADVSAEIAEEMGDVLFSCVNLSRHLGLDAEATLRGASHKFEARFRAMETAANESGRQFEELAADEMDALWEAAKLSLR